MPIIVSSTPPTVRIDALVQQTLDLLGGMERVLANKLSADINNSVTTITFTYAIDGMARGSIVEIEDELVYVWSVDTSAKQITACIRGFMGSATNSHLAASSIVTVNPRFPRVQIYNAMQSEIRSWGPQLFQLISADITPSLDIRGYQLTEAAFGDFYHIVDVEHSNVVVSGETNPKSWPRIHDWRLIRSADTTDFPSGHAIVLSSAWRSPLPTIRVTVAAPFRTNFASWATGANDVCDQTGVVESMLDIIPLGAAWRMMMTREVRRTGLDVGADPVSNTDVPPDYMTRTAARLKVLRDTRISEEALKLKARVPSAGWG